MTFIKRIILIETKSESNTTTNKQNKNTNGDRCENGNGNGNRERYILGGYGWEVISVIPDVQVLCSIIKWKDLRAIYYIRFNMRNAISIQYTSIYCGIVVRL